MVGSRTEDFRWLALASLAAVGTSVVMYTFWLRRLRGHLLHWPPFTKEGRFMLRNFTSESPSDHNG